MKAWGDELAFTARSLGIADSQQGIIRGGVEIQESELLEVGRDVSAFLKLLVRTSKDFFSNDRGKMAEWLGYSSAEAALLTGFDEKIEYDVFARADLIRENGKWSLIEINIGTMVGLTEYASLPRLSGLVQKFDVLKTRFECYARKWNLTGHLAFVIDQEFIDLARAPLILFGKELAEIAPLKVSALGHREIRNVNGRLCGADAQPIDFIYRYFDEHRILLAPSEFQEIVQAIREGSVQSPMGLTYNLISNKAMLALLKSGEVKLTSAEQSLVDRFVPETFIVDSAMHSTLVKNQEKWVLKPTNDLQGKDVAIGKESSVEEWNKLTDYVCLNPQSRKFVAQKYRSPEIVDLLVCNSSKSWQESARLVWGIYIFGDKLLGGVLRAKAVDNTSVINVANGGFVGPLPPL